jgi:hypothetical protein
MALIYDFNHEEARRPESQSELNYDETPGWYYPIRELPGAALLIGWKPKMQT